MSDYFSMLRNKTLLEQRLNNPNLSNNERERLNQQLMNARNRIYNHKKNTARPQRQSNSSLSSFVRISNAEQIPTHFRQISIFSYNVEFRNLPQPENIFERLIKRLFDEQLEGGLRPQRIGLSFRCLPSGDAYFIPLRDPDYNTYPLMSREVERRKQSDDEMAEIRNLKMQFKLTLQWQQQQGFQGACRPLNQRQNTSNEIDVSNPENNHCLAYTILAGIKLNKLKRRFKKSTNQRLIHWAENSGLGQQAQVLLEAAGCQLNKESYGLVDLEAIQLYLNRVYPQKFRLILVNLNTILWKGPQAEQLICIQHQDNHFTLIKNLAAYFGHHHKFCPDCESQAYRLSHNSGCLHHCKQCKRFGLGFPCKSDHIQRQCPDCKLYFMNQNCFDYHRQTPNKPNATSICANIKMCECGRIKNSHFRHKCLNVEQKDDDDDDKECKRCGMEHDAEHPTVCYIPTFTPKEKLPIRYIFWDAETEQINGKHVANLIVANQICSYCLDSGNDFDAELPNDAKCCCAQVREHVFENFDGQKASPVHQFLNWIGINETRKFRSIAIAHNSSRFDTHLAFEGALQLGLKPRYTANGFKIFTMNLNGLNRQACKFIDSFNFFLCGLDKLPKTFGLETNVHKLHFPIFFNKKENLNVELHHLPAKEFYALHSKSANDLREFDAWYEENRMTPFCLRIDLVDYCRMDVTVLRQACCKFRQLLMEKTGLDPWSVSATIASLTMKIYQSLFLKPGTLINTPERGYRKFDPQSMKARRWLRWFADFHQVRVQSSESSEGEHCVEIDGHVYKPDGLVFNSFGQVTQVLEFAGCFIHGCEKCHDPDDLLVGGRRQRELFEEFQARNQSLERYFNVEVCVFWECEYEEKRLMDCKFKDYVDNLELIQPMEIRRDCLRVEPFALLYECQSDEEILYFDICSLYPFIMAYGSFPLGHPQVLVPEHRQVHWKSSADNPYKGFINCKIRPPKSLSPPLLPYRSKASILLFPLCALCAESLPIGLCEHSDEERQWWSGYSSFELNAALDLGYEVVEVQEVWHWEKWADGEASMFKEFVDLFLKLKVENSGFPDYILNIVDPNARVAAKLQYIFDYEEREGIRLSYPDIQLNQTQRFICKLILNSLWGKYCQKVDVTRIELVKSSKMLQRLLDDDTIEIHDVMALNEQILRVSIKEKKEKPKQPLTNSLPIGALVTSMARLHLYSFLRKVGSNLLYCDTDSIIFVHKTGTPLPFDNNDVGPYLGQMTREYEKFEIKEFISAGPKNYGLKMFNRQDNTVECPTKIRGFRQTYQASEILNFDNIKQLILAKIDELHGQQVNDEDFGLDDEEEHEPNILSVTYHQIKRNKHGELHSIEQVKNYRFSYSKGLINSDFTVTPFGTQL